MINNLKNLKIVIQFILCIPGTYATIERLFSHMNCLWIDDKNLLNISTVKVMVIVKMFFKENWYEFFKLLSANVYLLKQINSSEKYNTKNNLNIKASSLTC